MDQLRTHAHIPLLIDEPLSLLLEVELTKRLAWIENVRWRQSLRDSAPLLFVIGARLVNPHQNRVIGAMQGSGDADAVGFPTVGDHVILVTLAQLASHGQQGRIRRP